MTKETKNTVAAETIVENLKEFANKLHDDSKEAAAHYLQQGNVEKFKTANVIHNVTHDLLDILDGKTAKEIFGDDEDDSPVVGSISVNLKTGDVHGIEDIKDPELKEKIAEVIGKVSEKLGGK